MTTSISHIYMYIYIYIYIYLYIPFHVRKLLRCETNFTTPRWQNHQIQKCLVYISVRVYIVWKNDIIGYTSHVDDWDQRYPYIQVVTIRLHHHMISRPEYVSLLRSKPPLHINPYNVHTFFIIYRFVNILPLQSGYQSLLFNCYSHTKSWAFHLMYIESYAKYLERNMLPCHKWYHPDM